MCFKTIYYVDRRQSPSAGSTFAPIAAPAASARTASATAHSTVRISSAAGAGGRPALLQRASAGPGVGSASGAGTAAYGGSAAGGGQWVGGKRSRWPPSAHQSPFPLPPGQWRCSAVQPPGRRWELCRLRPPPPPRLLFFSLFFKKFSKTFFNFSLSFSKSFMFFEKLSVFEKLFEKFKCFYNA